MFKHSELTKLADPSNFQWSTGIEDTFITAPWPKTGRILDEYELTQHYAQWETDLELAKHLGVQSIRYGIPWHKINPAPNQWDWTWADRPLLRLLELGINPIVDLVHYGLPPWIEQAYLHPDFPKFMAEYSAKVAERFRGQIYWYTPLNEPRITAWYCGQLGWWPPCVRGSSGFVSVMIAVCRGIVESHRAIKSVDSENVLVHVDATDLYESEDDDLLAEVARRQEIVFLALDLVTGKVHDSHFLARWLTKNKGSETQLAWFADNLVTPDILGINMYPMFTRKRLGQSNCRLRSRMVYGGKDMLIRLGELYSKRYHLPLMISETASIGAKRKAWLDDSIAGVRELRCRNVPLMGYTWWPMFSLVAWAYRQSSRPAEKYLLHMGLWDLHPDPNGNLNRIPTPLVEQYKRYIDSGI